MIGIDDAAIAAAIPAIAEAAPAVAEAVGLGGEAAAAGETAAAGGGGIMAMLRGLFARKVGTEVAAKLPASAAMRDVIMKKLAELTAKAAPGMTAEKVGTIGNEIASVIDQSAAPGPASESIRQALGEKFAKIVAHADQMDSMTSTSATKEAFRGFGKHLDEFGQQAMQAVDAVAKPIDAQAVKQVIAEKIGQLSSAAGQGVQANDIQSLGEMVIKNMEEASPPSFGQAVGQLILRNKGKVIGLGSLGLGFGAEAGAKMFGSQAQQGGMPPEIGGGMPQMNPKEMQQMMQMAMLAKMQQTARQNNMTGGSDVQFQF